jgi:hypothetical protein
LNCFRSENSPASLETSYGRNRNPCRVRKRCLCPIKQRSGGSALRGSHFRLPFALSFTPGSSPFPTVVSVAKGNVMPSRTCPSRKRLGPLSLPSLDLPERLLITRMANELPRRVCTLSTVPACLCSIQILMHTEDLVSGDGVLVAIAFHPRDPK